MLSSLLRRLGTGRGSLSLAIFLVILLSARTVAVLADTDSSPLAPPPPPSSGESVNGQYIVEMPSQPVVEALTNQPDMTTEEMNPSSGGDTTDESPAPPTPPTVSSLIDAITAEQNDYIARMHDAFPDATITVGARFHDVLNGIVIQTDAATAEQIPMEFPELTVFPDRQVQATLDQSVPQIGANLVWQQKADGTPCQAGSTACVTGRGVRVGVIDSGIAYTHPDLGGCLGPMCKVKGGWDFVHNDSDPMDDNGHGTHVASIIAGQDATGQVNGRGALNGVAPGVDLYAYKVLDSTGYGETSNIIAGIERSADPNQDHDFSDHLNVINISLNCDLCNSSNDPLSQAVDTVTDAGVVAVVSVGNSGPGDWTVGAPATARSAITVGAVDKSGALPDFSASGPTAEFLMKPDVLAPGVGICAAEWGTFQSSLRCKDNSHVALDGTSMAAPHVAGLAALMLQAHPTWTPDQIKYTLRGTAKRSGPFDVAKVRMQGYGIVSATDAVFAATPYNAVTLQTAGPFAQALIDINADVEVPNVQSWTLSVQSASTGVKTVVASGTSAPPSLLTWLDTATLTRLDMYFLLLEVTDTQGRVSRDVTVIESTRPPASADVGVSVNAPASLNTSVTSFTHTFTVTNAGPATSQAVQLIYAVPTTVTLLSSNAGCTQAGTTITCALGDMASGTNRTVSMTFKFVNIPPCNTPYQFVASVASPTTPDQSQVDNVRNTNMQTTCSDLSVCNGVSGVTNIPTGMTGLLRFSFKNNGGNTWTSPVYTMIPDPAFTAQKLSTFTGSPLPQVVAPNGTVLFNVPVQYSLPAGKTSAQVVVVGKIAKNGTSLPSDTAICGRTIVIGKGPAPTAMPKYTCISATGPASLKVGTSGTVVIKVKNTGTESWTVANHQFLPDYATLSTRLPSFNGAGIAAQVAKNATVTFTIPITAPSAVGTYSVKGRMTYAGIYPAGSTACGVTVKVTP